MEDALRSGHQAFLPGMLLALAASACAATPVAPTSAKDNAAMHTPASSPPDLSAEEIGRRFLKLVGSIESRSDLNLDLIEEIIGVRLTLIPGKLSTGFSSRDLGGGWRYGFEYIPESVSLKPGVGLDFENQHDEWSDMTPVCALDFEHYHAALKTSGFRDAPIHGEIGELLAWRYYRNDVTISVIPQNVIAQESGRLCVRRIGTLNGR